jgi:hypothetical protein
MSGQLTADQIVEQSRKATGLERFDSESYREGLEILLEDLTRVGQNPPPQAVQGMMVQALSTRLKTTAYLDSRPELLERPIERPIFVMGIPRTGTTLLNNLLAADPNRRSALTWEIDDPVPPPTSATLYTDPRALARLAEHEAQLAADPESGKYYRSSPIYPNECIFFMWSDFKALMWESVAPLRNYRDWLVDCDMSSAYAYHKRFLQLLQADAPGTWNLKMPSHGLWLDALTRTYPDARLVWTHRDPLTATGSFCSLIENVQLKISGNGNTEWVSEDMPWQAVKHADRIMDFRDKAGEDRVIDVHYADLIRDPIPTMRNLYKALGDEFTPEAEAGMTSWLADNPQGKFGKHEYKLARYGLEPKALRDRFERYLSRYNVEREGT